MIKRLYERMFENVGRLGVSVFLQTPPEQFRRVWSRVINPPYSRGSMQSANDRGLIANIPRIKAGRY